jgi:RNA polymerase sigma-70 factor, ECF subfamily
MGRRGRAADAADTVALVTRARDGDATAFSCLVEQHRPLLVRFCARLVGDASGAEAAQDLAQEVLLRAHRSLGRLQEPARFRAWLCGIAANLVRSWWRRSQPAASLDALARAKPGMDWEPLLLAPPTPEQVAVEAERAQRVRDAVESLSPNLGRAVALYYLQGLSYAEAAAALEVPVSTVKSRLHQSRAQLRRVLSAGDAPAPTKAASTRPARSTKAKRRGTNTMPATQAPPESAAPSQGMHCSFCARPHAAVPHLIAGPGGVSICSDCVAKCNVILATAQGSTQPPSPQPSPTTDQLGRYVGRYRDPKVGELEIKLAGTRLSGSSPQLPPGTVITLVPNGSREHAFRMEGGPQSGEVAVFETDAKGAVTGVTVGTYRLRR